MEKYNILEICDVYQPKTVATKEFVPNGQYSVYGANGIIGNYDKYNHENSEVLMACRGATCGAINVSKPYSWINGNAMVIHPKGNIPIKQKYLAYCLQASDKRNIISGTAQPQITRNNMKLFQLPLCEIEEQELIVIRIEELFSELDKAVETLQTTKQQLAVYRQAVLNEAFSNSESWPQYEFGKIMDVVRNGYGNKPADSGDYRILTIGSVRSLALDLCNYRLNNQPFDECDLIAENDLLFTRYNGSKEFVGVCAVVPKLKTEYAYPDKLIKFRPHIQDADYSKYLAYYSSSGIARKYLRSKIKTTSGQNGIAGTDIKKMTIHIPSMEVIHRIVFEIESRLSVCESIEQTVDTALAQADAMRQSILKQAFEGGF